MDDQFFQAINQSWGSNWLDIIMPVVSDYRMVAAPVLVFCLLYLAIRFKREGILLWVCAIIVILIGDLIGNLLKMLFLQLRPCAELTPPDIRFPHTRIPIRCSLDLTGMPSNHALNFFLFTCFMGVIFRSTAWWVCFLMLSFVVALSRVYLGLHYPSQVLVGGIVGILVGLLSAFFVQTKWPLIARPQLALHSKD